jgi:hypothetical protein
MTTFVPLPEPVAASTDLIATALASMRPKPCMVKNAAL